MKCKVKSCENMSSQGRFVGSFCTPCYSQIKKLENLRGSMNTTEEVKSDLMVNALHYIEKLTKDLRDTNGRVVLCMVQGKGVNSNPRKEYLKKISEGVYVCADGTQYGQGWSVKEVE